ncbi:MAG: M28 family peptidase [Candidatus Aminicenantes bacterium]|nr:MAG: M28 family peptidase [Candidatus Aminicenantes bacterium]
MNNQNLASLTIRIFLLLSIVFLARCAMDTGEAEEVDRWLVPQHIREAVLNEFSGELALRHVEILAVDRDRQEEEYSEQFMETEYVSRMAELYGLSDVKVDFFPKDEIWDAVEAELWMIEPVKKKIAGLEIVPEALASGSRDADVTAEVVYVGAGREKDFRGKNARGKIVMGSGSVGGIFASAVSKRKAVGVLGTGSSGVNRGYPGVSPDQIGWQSVRPQKDEKGFGFVLSKRQHDEIRSYLDANKKVVMKARVRTRMLPYKMNVVSAAIPGTDPEASELLMVAHLFERIATPGANDNCSGVATILEVGRTLARLISQGILEAPRRTIRFLWVPEISGTREFMYKYPQSQDKLMAVLNFDMTGADLKTTDAYLRMKKTPDSCPSYLNDLIANLLLCVDQTFIRTQWGTNSQFNYRLCPFISGSDHTVFLAAGIPAIQFNYYSDNFYHSSEDRSKHVDPTEMKRVGFMAAAGFYYLANAASQEAQDLAWESAANGEKWMAEVSRQSIILLQDNVKKIHPGYQAAQNKIEGAFLRAQGNLMSVTEISETEKVAALVAQLTASLESSRENHSSRLANLYRIRCAALEVEPQEILLTEQEELYHQKVPRRLFPVYTEDYKKRNENVNKHIPKKSPRMPYLARFEVPILINGKRSVLDIYRIVRATYGFASTRSDESKYAYVINPDSPDVKLQSVVDYITAMEKAGLVEIEEK